MKRELEEYFPQVFGKYYYDGDNEVIKEVCHKIIDEIQPGHPEWNSNVAEENLHHYFNISNSNLLRYDDRFKDFEKFLLDAATDYFTDVLEYELNGSNLLITDCWLNHCSKEHCWQIKHNHNNCIIVGTYFVDFDPKIHSPLDFYRVPQKEGHPVIQQMRSPRIANEGNKYTKEVHQTKPQEGCLFIWSAETVHGYEGVFNLWKGRTTISMNFIPEILDNGKYAFKVVPLQHVSAEQLNKRKELDQQQ